jgi:hypothetical protein
LRIANWSALPLTIALLILVPALSALSATADKTDKPFHYEDDRLGEKKDESDRFKFVRIKHHPMVGWSCIGDPPCAPFSHDYPEAGLHFSKILKELSKLDVVTDENEYILSFDDPNVFKYPFAYLCEAGYMDLTDAEVTGLREYLLRGGFLLVDDFRRRGYRDELSNFRHYVNRALPEPEYQMKRLDITHPIFNCFFSIKTLDIIPKYDRNPEYYGIEDKHGRLMMIVNYNNDVSEYWEWSNDPFQPIEDSNTAYKFGVNYVFYALTH